MNYVVAFDRVKDQMTELDYNTFMVTMGMLFDEYHRINKQYDAVKMSQEVARLVCLVNMDLGEYT